MANIFAYAHPAAEIIFILCARFAVVCVSHFEVIMNSNSAFDIVQDIILTLHGRIAELEIKLETALNTIEIYESIEKDMEKAIKEWQLELARVKHKKGSGS